MARKQGIWREHMGRVYLYLGGKLARHSGPEMGKRKGPHNGGPLKRGVV